MRSIGKVLPRQETAEKREARETTGQLGDLHSPSASVFRLPQLVGGQRWLISLPHSGFCFCLDGVISMGLL